MVPEAICFMVHFRIDNLPLNFGHSTCLNMKESRSQFILISYSGLQDVTIYHVKKHKTNIIHL